MYTEDFEIVWKLYPRRLGSQGSKRVSFRKYVRALETFTHEQVVTAIENYKKECDAQGKTGTEFVKMFECWMSKGKGSVVVRGSFNGIIDYQDGEIETAVTDPKWQKVRYFALKESNGSCCLCGRTAKDGIKLHVDHIKPKSLYPELKYELSNLQVLCCDCNIGKSNLDDTDWR